MTTLDTVKLAYGKPVKLKLEALREFQGELKELSEDNYQKLKKEILNTGFAFAAHAWKDPAGRWWLVDGHQRCRVLRKLQEEGYKVPDLPVVPVHAKNLREAKRRVLQGTSQYGHMTEDGLKEFIIDAHLKIEDVKLSFDFPTVDMPSFVTEHFREAAEEAIEAEEATPDVPAKPVVKLGDLWTLGSHRLLCGDSTSEEQVSKLMGDNLAEMVFTDPPYGVEYDGGHANEKRREELQNDDSTAMYAAAVPIAHKFSNDKAPLYLWFTCSKALDVLTAVKDASYEVRSWIIWNKNMAQFGAIGAQYKLKHEPCIYAFKKGQTPIWEGPTNEVSVWDIDRASKNEFHPTQKPVALCERAIANHKPTSVLDLFGGSGSTLIACEKVRAKAFVMELDPAYCQVILKRWAEFTSLDPVRQDGQTFSKVLKSQTVRRRTLTKS